MTFRSRRVAFSLTIALAVLSASCSPSTGDDDSAESTNSPATADVSSTGAPTSTELEADTSTTDGDASDTTVPSDGELAFDAETAPTIRFVNPDGTAEYPSRPIFTLTNADDRGIDDGSGRRQRQRDVHRGAGPPGHLFDLDLRTVHLR